MAWRSHPTTVKVVWHNLSTGHAPAALWLGVVVGATLVPFLFAAIATASRRSDPTWLAALAALPALGSAVLGALLPSGPILYPQSMRIEERAASIASQWWHSSQLTAAGFYATTLLLLVAGAASATAACSEAPRQERRRRRTVVALLGAILVVAIAGAWLHRAQFQTNLAVQYDMILFPAAVALVSLAIVHGAAGPRVPGKHSFAACLCALLALYSFALAQSWPAGSNADVLDLSPFEWVIASENLIPKLQSCLLPGFSYLVPLVVASFIALRGLPFSWKNLLSLATPAFALLMIGMTVASKKSNHHQQQLARAFRAHVPADLTLASGAPGSLTSCTDLSVDKILFVGRENVTLNGQKIASTRDLVSPKTCAEIAQRVQASVPRLAFDENVPFRQTTCLLDAFAHRKPRVCKVTFVGRCKAGTHVHSEEIPACTEHLQNSVPFCAERLLDVEGCPAAEVHGPFVALTPQHVHVVGWGQTHAPDPWPAKPIEDNGRWKNLDIPIYWATLGVTDDTTMGGFMAVALQSKHFRLRLSTPAAPEFPKAVENVNPLGVRVNAMVVAETEKVTAEVLEGLLKKQKSSLRRCLEPRELPWFYAVGRAHGVLGKDGTFVGTWSERNPDDQFAGCITKILREMRAPPMEQPLLAEIRSNVIATIPRITAGSELKPRGVRVNPANENVHNDVSYWHYALSRMVEYQPDSRSASLQCLMPALRRGAKPRGYVDFDISLAGQETRVKARSKDIPQDVVTCLEDSVSPRASAYFRHRLQQLPLSFAVHRIDPNTKFQVSLDMVMTMYIETPEAVEDLPSEPTDEP